MGCAASQQRGTATDRAKEHLPLLRDATHARGVDNEEDLRRSPQTTSRLAPTALPQVDLPQVHPIPRNSNTVSDGEGRSPQLSPFNTLGMLDASKSLAAQASLSNSTQRQNGVSDNVSLSSSCNSAEDWYPREFGPIVHSTYAKLPTLAGNHGEYADEDYCDDDSDKVGFYMQYVRRTGGGISKTIRDRTVTAKDLLKRCSTDGANVRVTTNGTGGDGRTNRRALADEMGPVDVDLFVTALYEQSRERERTKVFIDNDGEIRRLYHTEGWHRLPTPVKRKHSSRRRPGSSEGHNTHKSRHSSGTGGTRKSSKDNLSGATSRVGNDNSAFQMEGVQSADNVGGAVPTLRNTRYGSAGTLFTAERYAAATPQATQRSSPGAPQQGQQVPRTSRPAQETSPQRPAPSNLYSHPSSNLSGTTTSVSSGRASTLPGSRGPAGFYAQAFGDPTPRVAPILVHSDRDLAGSFPAAPAGGSILRRSSAASVKYEVSSDGKSVDGDSAVLSPRRPSSTPGKVHVSFSRDTQFFKKDSFYVTPRHEKDSEYTDLTPLQDDLKVQPALVTAEPPSSAMPSPQSPASQHGSHPQLTLLKDKMSHNRDRVLH